LKNAFETSIHPDRYPDPFGTAIVLPDESEPKIGRLIIFQWADGKLTQLVEKEVKGGVWKAKAFNDKLVTTINSTVRLWEWTHEKELRLECSHFNNIIALFAEVSGDFILVGDLIHSITLLQYKPMEANLEEIARDYSSNWMTACAIIDDEKFLGAETSSNLFVCQRDSGANTEEERSQMTEVGQIHLGEFVNVFRHGTLVMQHLGDVTVKHQGPILMGTVEGSIKLITQIEKELYDMLLVLQNKLNKKIKSVGRIEHHHYRKFFSEKKEELSHGFIDGDVIESFLDLDRNVMEELCVGLPKVSLNNEASGDNVSTSTREDVMKIVEDLTRIH